jgi:SAM-dependent methyltransferase
MSEADREAWNERHGDASAPSEASPFLIGLDPILPRLGRALDVAGGRGRHAVWLARRGLDATLADVSDVGLFIASQQARAEGVALTTLRIDFGVSPLPPGPWDVLVSFCFLDRPLFATYGSALAPGGFLVIAHPTRRNLERHARPPAQYLLEEGELPSLVAGPEASGLEVISYQEGWCESDRHEARLVARRRRDAPGALASR